jgi:hypothetical protein
MTIDLERLAVDADYWDENSLNGFLVWNGYFMHQAAEHGKKRIVIGCLNNILMTELLC